MKLEIRHLAPYLPYGILVKIIENPCKDEIHKLTGIPYDGLVHLGNGGMFGFTQRDYNKIKPILRPLSDLTKEIEIDGKKFVPIVEILKVTSLLDLSECKFDIWQDEEKFITIVYVNAENKNGRIIDSMYYNSNVFFQMNNDGSYGATNPQYEPQQLLLNYHFDVFGLIDAGLAIDINTLNNTTHYDT